jgi:hypothetical protein
MARRSQSCSNGAAADCHGTTPPTAVIEYDERIVPLRRYRHRRCARECADRVVRRAANRPALTRGYTSFCTFG